MNAPRLLLCAVIVLGAFGCSGREIGKVTLTERGGAAETKLTGAKAGSARFVVNVEIERPTNNSNLTDWWNLELEIVRDGKVVRTKICDALNIGFATSVTESCTNGCTAKYSRARVVGCAIDIDAGESTLRASLAPKEPGGVHIKTMELFVLQ